MRPRARPANLVFEVRQIEELIGLAAKFIRNHRRLSGERGHNGDPLAQLLERGYKAPEIAIAGKNQKI
jgi:hypothetical protein